MLSSWLPQTPQSQTNRKYFIIWVGKTIKLEVDEVGLLLPLSYEHNLFCLLRVIAFLPELDHWNNQVMLLTGSLLVVTTNIRILKESWVLKLSKFDSGSKMWMLHQIPFGVTWHFSVWIMTSQFNLLVAFAHSLNICMIMCKFIFICWQVRVRIMINKRGY